LVLVFTPAPLPGSEQIKRDVASAEKEQVTTKKVDTAAPTKEIAFYQSKPLPEIKMSSEAVAYVKKLVGPFSSMGTVTGQGNSIFSGESIEFNISGTYDFTKLCVQATKQHTGKYNNQIFYNLALDLSLLEDFRHVTLKASDPHVYLEHSTKNKKEAKESCLCVVCYEQKLDMLLQPCNHACCCALCAALVQKCPVCRSPITNRIKIYLTLT
jgi:hypothetical protein